MRQVTFQNMTTLSDRTREICRTYWNTDKNGLPGKTCCQNCPIIKECYAPAPTTLAGLDKHNADMNAAAELVPLRSV
jgi:hypothetical protein